jgi:RNA polymerase sigma factor (sigma-70 family)
MVHSVAPMDDRQTVAAMCARTPSGLAAAYDTYAARLYAYSRSILSDDEAAADAVHDAFLIAGQRIGELRDPDRLRPWLYAIVRHECLRQLRTRSRNVELAEAGQVRDESIDLDAGLRTEQHRELIWSAAAGLNPRDREVLELSVRHGLDGADLAAALGVSPNHAHALVSRARQQLERALTVVVVARTGRRDCATLDALLTGWDGVLTALWRKRIARHIEHCEACGGTKRREVRAVALLTTVPFVALPIALRDRVLTAAANPQLAAYHTDLATRADRFNRDGFPRSTATARQAGLAAPPRLAIPGAAAVLMVGALLFFLHGPVGDLLAVSSDSTTSTAASEISAGSQQTPMGTGTNIQSVPRQSTNRLNPPDHTAALPAIPPDFPTPRLRCPTWSG